MADPLQMLMQVAGPLLQGGGGGGMPGAGMPPQMKMQIGQAMQDPKIQALIGQAIQQMLGSGQANDYAPAGLTPQLSGDRASAAPVGMGVGQNGNGPNSMLLDRAMHGMDRMPGGTQMSPEMMARGMGPSIGGGRPGSMPMNPPGRMGPGDQRPGMQPQEQYDFPGQQMMGQYLKTRQAPTDSNEESLDAMRAHSPHGGAINSPGANGMSTEEELAMIQQMMSGGKQGQSEPDQDDQ